MDAMNSRKRETSRSAAPALAALKRQGLHKRNFKMNNFSKAYSAVHSASKNLKIAASNHEKAIKQFGLCNVKETLALSELARAVANLQSAKITLHDLAKNIEV